jgi:hypothetical protein
MISDYVPESVSGPFELLNQLINFHEFWYEFYAIGCYRFYLPAIGNNGMVEAGPCMLEAALTTLNLGPSNEIE